MRISLCCFLKMIISFEINIVRLFREHVFSTFCGKDARKKAVKLCDAMKFAMEYVFMWQETKINFTK